MLSKPGFYGARALLTVLVALSLALFWRVGHALPVNPLIVGLTAPANGATFSAPANIALTATATDLSGEDIYKVEFFNGTTRLGTDFTTPYSFTWSNVPVGSYSLTAKATNGIGVTRTSAPVTITVSANGPPNVSLTSPTGGAVVISGQTTTLAASASDANGVSKVEFFDGATLVATDSTAPYSVPWSSTVLGSHSLTARATDVLGAARTSAPVTVSVIALPIYAAQFIGQSVPTTMVAGQSYAVSVQMKNTGSAIWTAAEAYNLGSQNPRDNSTWGLSRVATPGSVGNGQTATFNFTARAPTIPGTQNFQWRMLREGVIWFGDITPNVAINVLANPPPSVSLTAPSAGAVVLSGQTITLTASASDANGVSEVEFFDNGVPVAPPDTLAPYSVNWSSTALGSHNLSARATDTLGAVRTSAPVAVTVIVNALPTVSMPTPPTQTAPAGGTCTFSLSASANDSDGSIAKVEFLNSGVLLPGTTGNLNPDTTAPYAFTWNNVAPGSYSLSARATDNRGATATSSVVTASCGGPLIATLTAPANGSSYTRPDGPTLTATANTSAGTISKVEFFDNGVKLGEDLTSPYTYPVDGTTWNTAAVAAGSHSLTARATNSLGTVGPQSVAVTITLLDPLLTITLTAPSAGASFTAPANITLSATASDANGTITQVEFLNDGVALPESTGNPNPDPTAPYAFTWSNVPVGSYTITATATNNSGATSTTSAIAISVVEPAMCFLLPQRPGGAP